MPGFIFVPLLEKVQNLSVVFPSALLLGGCRLKAIQRLVARWFPCERIPDELERFLAATGFLEFLSKQIDHLVIHGEILMCLLEKRDDFLLHPLASVFIRKFNHLTRVAQHPLQDLQFQGAILVFGRPVQQVLFKVFAPCAVYMAVLRRAGVDTPAIPPVRL